MPDVHFSASKKRVGHSKDQAYVTPAELYDYLDAEFRFDFDPCPENPQFDGLAVEWGTSSYVNPPYRDCRLWVRKAHVEWLKGKTVVLLIPASVSTEWYHDCVCGKAEVRFIRGRIKFVDVKTGKKMKTGVPLSLMIVVFRDGRQSFVVDCACPKGKELS